MKFRLLSDLHLEFQQMQIPALEDDANTVLVLAGDIGLADKPHTYKSFIANAANQFRDVIWICGNHEYYHSSLVRGIPKIKKHLEEMEKFDGEDLSNVHFDDNFTVVIDDTAFICATLWTDMNKEDPFTMFDMPNRLNDFRLIRTGPAAEPYQKRMRPFDVVVAHKFSKEFIFSELEKYVSQGLKTVVVTHHGPSHKSIHEMFARDTITNGAYVSELGDQIIDAKGPNVWVHGHTHCSFDYMIGDITRVVVNPRGYAPHDLNEDFDPNMVIEV